MTLEKCARTAEVVAAACAPIKRQVHECIVTMSCIITMSYQYQSRHNTHVNMDTKHKTSTYKVTGIR
jgi:hypothetical protein